MNATKHYEGCYRVREDGLAYFGQIKRVGREWHAEIRRGGDGELMRYAGIWSTKRDAVEECASILSRGHI
jgi:hypothetical protein